ncbi:MAG: cupin domain-containing protein [Roseovarius sp.]
MPGSPRHVLDFSDTAVDGKESTISDPAAVDRPYTARSWRHFERPESGALAGIWEAEPHLERVDCDYDELCHLLEGRVRLTDADGVTQEFGPGDSFVVAAGFTGTWENLTPVRKVFFILQPDRG